MIKQCFGALNRPLYYICNILLQSSLFQEEMEIARVTPTFKGGKVSDLGNYHPISALCCFSKILEKICIIIFTNIYLTIIYFIRKSLNFKKIIQLITQLFNQLVRLALAKNYFTLGVFMDLPKVFDTVDCMILIEKLDYYSVNGNLLQFKSYLNNRRQFITYDYSNTSFANISRGIPQGSILGPLLFLLYINDLPNTSPVLDPIIYADDTNLFYSNNDTETFFFTINMELEKISEWFKANK